MVAGVLDVDIVVSAHVLADLGKRKGKGRSWAQQLQLDICTAQVIMSALSIVG